MNERIQQLKDQCWVEKRWDNGMWIEKHIDLELFARLIVRECIAQCESQNTIITTATGIQHWGEISDAVEQIREHFGVEE